MFLLYTCPTHFSNFVLFLFSEKSETLSSYQTAFEMRSKVEFAFGEKRKQKHVKLSTISDTGKRSKKSVWINLLLIKTNNVLQIHKPTNEFLHILNKITMNFVVTNLLKQIQVYGSSNNKKGVRVLNSN